MIILQLIGMIIITGFCLWVCALGFMAAVFNNIGGAGNWKGVCAGLLFAVLGFGAAVVLWLKFSPLAIVVSP